MFCKALSLMMHHVIHLLFKKKHIFFRRIETCYCNITIIILYKGVFYSNIIVPQKFDNNDYHECKIIFFKCLFSVYQNWTQNKLNFSAIVDIRSLLLWYIHILKFCFFYSLLLTALWNKWWSQTKRIPGRFIPIYAKKRQVPSI